MTFAAVFELKAARVNAAALHRQQQQPLQPPPAEHVQHGSQLVPQTTFVAPLEELQGEVLALLTRLCKGRLQPLLQRQQQAGHASPASVHHMGQQRGSDKVPIHVDDVVKAMVASALENAVPLFAELCCVPVDPGGDCSSCSTIIEHRTPTDETAGEPSADFACSTPSAITKFLPYQHTLTAAAAHAADVLVILEGNMRLSVSSATPGDTEN
jgi:hypothetical protein